MTRIVVSLAEETTAATLARMGELADVADVFEVRADLVRNLDLDALLRSRTKPLLLTCRAQSEGGGWPDGDGEGRRRLLREAVERGVDMVDVEHRAGFDDVVKAKAGHGLVLSFHDLEGTPADLEGLFERMAASGADVVKIATTARSVADLGRLAHFASRHAEGPPGLVAFAMGPLGVPSRLLGGRWGAPFVYAAAGAGREVAPGQLPAAVLERTYRVRTVGPATRVYGLLGSDVLRSPSPAIHNRAFAERGIDAVYVPLPAESLPAFLQALPALDLAGFSVTRPYKVEILPHLARVDAVAAATGSVNTVVVGRDGALEGSSTDGDGVLGPLRRRLDPAGRSVVILGAGGAARAAAVALARARARVSVLARRSEQAQAVAAVAGARYGALDELAGLAWDVLVHATPVGSGAFPGQSLVPERLLRPGALVFDMVYEPRPTPLLRAAQAAGCVTVDGLEMLLAQAAGQFETWTGVPAPVEAMREAAVEVLEEGR